MACVRRIATCRTGISWHGYHGCRCAWNLNWCSAEWTKASNLFIPSNGHGRVFQAQPYSHLGVLCCLSTDGNQKPKVGKRPGNTTNRMECSCESIWLA